MRTRYAIHNFPTGIKPARFVRLEIANDEKDLILYEPSSLQPKKKQKPKDRKRRYFEANFTFANEVLLQNAQLSLDSKQVLLIGRIASPIAIRNAELTADEIELIHYFDTGSNRKVLSAFYMRKENPPANIHWVMARYDQLFAVDTNSVSFVGTKRISVTTAVVGVWRQTTVNYSMGEYKLYYVSIDEDVEGNPELYALSTLMRSVQENLPEGFDGKIGFVTDTELGKIKEINFRRLPVYRDFYLPDLFELIYATGDSGAQEFFPNSMIRACDKNSTRVLNEFQEKNKLTKVI